MSRLLRPFLVLILVNCFALAFASAEDTRVFELRVYHPFPGKLEALQDRFRDHTLEIFKSHGMESIGYWTPSDGDERTLVYFVAFPNEAAQKESWKAFVEDPKWKAAYADSIKDGRLVERVDSELFVLKKSSPELRSERRFPARAFTLLRYTAAEGVPIALRTKALTRRGLVPLAIFAPANPSEGGESTLLCLVASESAASLESAFAKDPDGVALLAKGGKGVRAKRNGTSFRPLQPTDYSLIR